MFFGRVKVSVYGVIQNYMLIKWWCFVVMGDNEVVDKLWGELEDFCVDKEGVFGSFWEFCYEVVRREV